MATASESLQRVRVEDATSIGRSYSRTTELIPGLGASRRALTSTAWRDAYGKKRTLESYTLAKPHMSKSTREDVMEYFLNTWELNDTLFCSLANDSIFYSIPDKLRRPLIFYTAHPAALYVNKMHQAGLLDKIDPFFEKLFETGVDEMSWDSMEALQHEDYPWPDMSDVIAFRDKVKAAVIGVIKAMPHPKDAPVTMASPWWALWMAFEHERIHIETSSVLIHQLPIDAVLSIPGWRTGPTFVAGPAEAPANEIVHVPAAKVTLGKPRDFPSFGWDNEYGHRDVDVPAFAASKFLVTNAEFLPFVMAGGYTERRWWVSEAGDDEGWRWRTFRNATHPSFWVATSHPDMARFIGGQPDYPYQKDDGHARAGAAPEFRYRSLFDIIEMPWDWPVEANYLEAAAFLRWKSAAEAEAAAAGVCTPGGSAGAGVYRLPTEAEFEAMLGAPHVSTVTTAAAAAGAGAVKAAAGAARTPEHEYVAAAAGGRARVPRSVVGTRTYAPAEGDKPVSAPVGGALEGAAAAGAGADAPVPALDAAALQGGIILPDGSSDVASEAAARAAAIASGDAVAALDIMMQPAGPGNTNLRWHSSTPVNMYPPSPSGVHDAQGNVWQWTEDHFAPLPGYEIHYLYDDFSAPCFDGWHTIIKGGSWVSTGDEASRFSRFHFRRHFFQHLGFRYVRLAPGTKEPFPGAATVTNLWEGMSTVSNGITNGYGTPADVLPVLAAAASAAAAGGAGAAAAVAPEPKVTIDAEAALNYGAALAKRAAAAYAEAVAASGGALPAASAARVLHLGCDVGSGSFELVAAGFGSVTGVDAHEPSVRHARLFQHHAQFEYERVEEGVLTTTTLARLRPGLDRSRVAFFVGDAAVEGGIPADVAVGAPGGFDLVIVDDLLCKQTQPLDLIGRIAPLVRAGGVVLVASGNDWDAAVTPRNSWMGGFKMNGEDMPTLHLVKYHLGRAGFAFASAADVLRLARKHARSFALDVIEVSAFVKRA